MISFKSDVDKLEKYRNWLEKNITKKVVFHTAILLNLILLYLNYPQLFLNNIWTALSILIGIICFLDEGYKKTLNEYFKVFQKGLLDLPHKNPKYLKGFYVLTIIHVILFLGLLYPLKQLIKKYYDCAKTKT